MLPPVFYLKLSLLPHIIAIMDSPPVADDSSGLASDIGALSLSAPPAADRAGRSSAADALPSADRGFVNVSEYRGSDFKGPLPTSLASFGSGTVLRRRSNSAGSGRSGSSSGSSSSSGSASSSEDDFNPRPRPRPLREHAPRGRFVLLDDTDSGTDSDTGGGHDRDRTALVGGGTSSPPTAPSSQKAATRGGSTSMTEDGASMSPSSSTSSLTSLNQLLCDGLSMKSPIASSTPDEGSGARASVAILSPLEPSALPTASGDGGGEAEGSAWVLDPDRGEYYLAGGRGGGNAPSAQGDWPSIRIPSELFHRLYVHQKAGVQWMATLHRHRIGGGILGDDMGLGKTFQTLSYLGGMMRGGTIRNALIICPVSVLRTWEREANDILKRSAVPRVTVSVVSSDTKKALRVYQLQNALDCDETYPHLVITTYGLVRSSTLDFISHRSGEGEKPGQRTTHPSRWDYVVCDEGHQLKNPATLATKSCWRVCRDGRTRRLLLTGTPIQNNLKELWALFDWATSSRLLGPLRRFQCAYGDPIEAGRLKASTVWTIRTAEKANKELQAKLRPHFLQRLKSKEFKEELPTKTELVVWTALSERQRSMYDSFLRSGMVASVLSGETASPLEAITWLKKLCGHTSLVDTAERSRIREGGTDNLVRGSSKLLVLHDLLIHLKQSGHRALIFSQSTKMLDIIQRAIQDKIQTDRIDGKTREKDRQCAVDRFNQDGSDMDAMLLSTKAAGIGLTLTGADRAIIFDPSWNPADDAQAVDRCFRIGQTKNVTVYRFICAGTVEEAMYARVVHKDGIKRAVTGSSGSIATERHFDKDDLRKIFALGPAGECEMLKRFNIKVSKSVAFHEVPAGDSPGSQLTFGGSASIKPPFLETHPAVVGMLSHDLMYTNSVIALDDEPAADPFCGTPMRKGKVMGRAQRALLKLPDAATKLDFACSPKDTNTMKMKHNIPVPSNKSSEPYIKIDDDSVSQHNVSMSETNMGKLLDALETGDLRGKEKLEVHEKIAALAVRLGWL